MVSPMQSPQSSTQTNVEALRSELEKLGQLNKRSQISAIEVGTIIARVSTLGKSVITEYSRKQAFSEENAADLLKDMKAKISEANALLKQKSTVSKLKILFSSTANKTDARLNLDGDKAISPGQHVKNKKEFIHNLTTSLTQLEQSIGDLHAHGIVIEHFKRDPTFPEQLGAFRDKFITGLFGKILNKLSSQIFLGHKPQIILSTSKKQMDELKAKLEQQNKQIGELVAKKNKVHEALVKLGKYPEAIKKLENELNKALVEKNKLEAMQKIKGKNENLLPELQIQLKQQNAKVKALQEKKAQAQQIIRKKIGRANFENFKTLMSQDNTLEKEISTLLSNKNETENKIKELQGKIDKAKEGLKLAQETRANLHTIGGNNFKLKLQDANLDGTYIACDSFRNALKEGGAQVYELNIQSIDNRENIALKGLFFPKGANGAVNKALNALGAFSSGEKTGAGWQKISVSDGIIIVTDEEANHLRKMGLLTEKGKFIQKSDYNYDYNKKDWDISQSQTGGTVLLTSGNAGVYEMHKREILGFLMRGMNVMAFNFRGYGESQGTPTGEGFKRDMEAAYQYLKTQHNIPDNKIMLKALCMSGGAAADLAAHHPDVNLFIDQSYANFDDIVKEQANAHMESFIKENHLDSSSLKALKSWVNKNLTSIVHAAVKLAAPAWSIEKEIGKVRGHVGILLTKQDTLMTLDRDVQKNYAAAMRGKQAQSITLMAMKGKHGESWLNSQSHISIIKPVKPEVAAQILASMPQGASILEENYYLTFAAQEIQDQNLEKFVANFPDAIPEEVEKFAKKFLQQLPEVLKTKAENARILKTDFESLIEDLTNQAAPHIKGPLKEFLMASITKKDIYEPYRRTVISGEKLNKKIADSIAKYPELRVRNLDKELIKKLNQFKTLLDNGSSIEEAMAEVTNVNPKFKLIIQDFLTGVIVPQEPFIGLQERIVQQIKEQKLSPKEADQFIKATIAKLPEKSQNYFEEFITKAIPIQADVALDENFQRTHYEGRLQMDQYLKKAKLMGALI